MMKLLACLDAESIDLVLSEPEKKWSKSLVVESPVEESAPAGNTRRIGKR